MKTRILLVTLMVVTMSIFVLGGQETQAQAPIDAVSHSVIYDFFTALNVGDMDSALSAFVNKASVGDSAGGRRSLDAVQLAATLDSWQHEGREYRVLQERTVNVARGLDVVFANLEIADRGLAWGRQSVIGLLYNGQIERLDVTRMRLTPIRY